MSTEEIFSLSACVLLVGACCGLITSPRSSGYVRLVLFFALSLLLIGFVTRWNYYVAHMDVFWLLAFPVSTFYESAAFLITAALVITLLYFKHLHLRLVALISLLCALSLLRLNFSAVPNEPVLFLPSLKSYWLVAHVTLSFTAYAMYALAALMGIWALCTPSKLNPQHNVLLALIRSLCLNATLIFTVGGLIFGAVWAQQSWGRFWAWDPKETWALITWCSYVLMLHIDYRKHLGTRQIALWSIVNFCIVLFTYIGVSALFAGLHSYISLPEGL